MHMARVTKKILVARTFIVRKQLNHFVALKNLNRLLIYQYKQIIIIANYLFMVLLSMLDNYAKTNHRKYMHDVAN